MTRTSQNSISGELSKCRFLVTGGAGFLGRFVCRQLEYRGVPAEQIVVPRRQDYDLTDAANVTRLFDHACPDVVIHLAAEVGGIGANRDNPGRMFYANLAMGLHLIEEARKRAVRKLVQVGTVCAYPKHTPVPFRESDLWIGYPEQTNAPYGIAKKALLVMCRAYRAQYGLNAIYLLPANLYGPHDNFDPETSHVIPALIRKFVEAVDENAASVTCWGDGAATREFLYVEDAAAGIVEATRSYDSDAPVNLGTGREISIRRLAESIAQLCGFTGRIEWDASKPNGQPRRCLDTSWAREAFGFEAQTTLEVGLQQTVEWYLAQPRAEVHA